jgi:hypothetical protein
MTCVLPELTLGGAKVQQIRVIRFNARRPNAELKSAGYAPIDGILGADVMDATSAVLDLAAGRLYMRPGSVSVADPENRVWMQAAPQISLPLHPFDDSSRRCDRLRLFVSRDQGTTWSQQTDYSPNESAAKYVAPSDGEYWLAIQRLWNDGRSVPDAPEKLSPELKVRVGIATQPLRPAPPPADLLQEVGQLRVEVAQLQRRLAELEGTGGKK